MYMALLLQYHLLQSDTSWSSSQQQPVALEALEVEQQSYQSLTGLLNKQVLHAQVQILLERLVIFRPSVLQFAYSISKVQLKMLQIQSRQATQRLTIRCKNYALGENLPTFTGFKRNTVFASGSQLAAEIVSNGCEVS